MCLSDVFGVVLSKLPSTQFQTVDSECHYQCCLHTFAIVASQCEAKYSVRLEGVT